MFWYLAYSVLRFAKIICVYGNTLVQLGGKVIEKRKIFHVPWIRDPLYYLYQHIRLLDCSYIGDNKGTHTFSPSFGFTINDRVDNMVICESMGTSGMSMEKSPRNDSILPHRAKISREYWYYAISHSVWIINICTGKISCWLPTPHKLVYGIKPYAQYWLPLFQ